MARRSRVGAIIMWAPRIRKSTDTKQVEQYDYAGPTRLQQQP